MGTRWAIWLALIPVCFVSAGTIYVDDDAVNDPGPGDTTISDPAEDGSAAHPFDAIQEAIDVAVEGDTVLVRDGTYTGQGNRDVDFLGKAITVQSENGPDQCIVDCQATENDKHRGFHFDSNEGTDSILCGLTIRNGWHDNGGGILCIESSPLIRECIITDNQTSKWISAGARSPSDGGGIWLGSSDAVLRNCVIRNNYAGPFCPDWGGFSVPPCETGRGGGLFSDSGSNPLLVNCLIYDNQTSDGYATWHESTGSWVCSDGGDGAGVYCFSAILENCTIGNNITGQARKDVPISCSDGVGGGICGTEETQVINSIIFGNSQPQIIGAAHPYPDIFGGIFGDDHEIEVVPVRYSLAEYEGEGNFYTDPDFADPDNGDYHLKSQGGRWDYELQQWVVDDATSPCIDAGDPSYPIGPEPFANGGRINMGAYGGTVEASKSYFGAAPCEIIVAGDINGDCKVNLADLAILALHWMEDWSAEPGLQYTVKLCDPNAELIEGDDLRFSAEVQGNYIHFEDVIRANCCADRIELQMLVEDYEITIIETEYTTMPCDCICDYPTTAILGPFEAGEYTLAVIQRFEEYETLIGTIEVQID